MKQFESFAVVLQRLLQKFTLKQIFIFAFLIVLILPTYLAVIFTSGASFDDIAGIMAPLKFQGIVKSCPEYNISAPSGQVNALYHRIPGRDNIIIVAYSKTGFWGDKEKLNICQTLENLANKIGGQ